jgi:nucleotide-binding universal stress UspA family protein
MSRFKTILVYVDFHQTTGERTTLAAGLAKRFGAKLSAVAACQIPLAPTPLGRQRFREFEQHEIQEQLDKLRDQFIGSFGQELSVTWTGQVGAPTRIVANEAQAADLIIVSTFDGSDMTATDIGDLALMAGRPVLVPTGKMTELPTKKILVAWNNTRESRRALADALPLLTDADLVHVATVGRSSEREIAESLDTAVRYLDGHAIKAEPMLIEPEHNRHIAGQLVSHATAHGCDLIVAGAYGHSRFREMAFGGVTHDLLHQAELSLLLSN